MQAGEMTRKSRLMPETHRTPVHDDNMVVYKYEQDGFTHNRGCPQP